MLGHVLLADSLPAAMAAANNNGHGTRVRHARRRRYLARQHDQRRQQRRGVLGNRRPSAVGRRKPRPRWKNIRRSIRRPSPTWRIAGASAIKPITSWPRCAMNPRAPSSSFPNAARSWRGSSATTWWRRPAAKARAGGWPKSRHRFPRPTPGWANWPLKNAARREHLAAFKAALEAEKVEAEALGARMLQLASEVESRKASLRDWGRSSIR